MNPILRLLPGLHPFKALLRTLRHVSQSVQLVKQPELCRVSVASGQGSTFRATNLAPLPPVGLPSDRETSKPAVRDGMPTRWQAFKFLGKVSLFRAQRWAKECGGRRPPRLRQQPLARDWKSVAESKSLLYPSQNAAEFALQAGKVQNLRAAARFLNGLRIPAGQVFSFWSNVPRPTQGGGFAQGRELREGCVIPNVGGGLCQLTNALYDVALKAGLEIVERHAHSRRLPGSMAAVGRDATIFWNYVDLRFRAKTDLHLEVKIEAHDLVVRLHSPSPVSETEIGLEVEPIVERREKAESCETCGIGACFRNPSAVTLARESSTAWVVDAYQPEFDAWMNRTRKAGDWLFVPLDGKRFRLRSYRWNTSGFAAIRQAPWTVLRRSLKSRRLAAQGASRQKALLAMDAAMADSFARRLPALATHLVISQNLLPFLWSKGHLGGRTFDVLMTRLPMAELQKRLDQGAQAHPESSTMADFRADPALVEAETAALAAARHWITPHSTIARLAGKRAVRLDWNLPTVEKASQGEWIVFPASTLGRKGAWELREAARALQLPVRLAGPVLESKNFWEGLQTERAGDHWLQGARVVVLPAWVENQPRRLLQALAAGIPVIASDACGLEGLPGVTTVPAGDVAALIHSVKSVRSTVDCGHL